MGMGFDERPGVGEAPQYSACDNRDGRTAANDWIAMNKHHKRTASAHIVRFYSRVWHLGQTIDLAKRIDRESFYSATDIAQRR